MCPCSCTVIDSVHISRYLNVISFLFLAKSSKVVILEPTSVSGPEKACITEQKEEESDQERGIRIYLINNNLS